MDKKEDIIIKKVVEDPDYVACLNKDEIEIFLDKVKTILDKEEALIELDGSVVFAGDTHGDFNTTKAILESFFDYDNIVFLGDYIDREPIKWGSIYNIIYLLIMKCCYPKKIFLLKGNHECNYIIPCYPYEFETDIINRYNSLDLHKRFEEVFSLMPLMISSKSVFASHGGFLNGYKMESLRRISKNNYEAIESIVWNDPVNSPIYRGMGYHYTKEDLKGFLDGINARVFIKGHDYNTLGYSIFNDRCLTIFSSSRYKDRGNGGILVAIIDKIISYVSDIIVKDFSKGKWFDYKINKM